jgi:hypothetical protein
MEDSHIWANMRLPLFSKQATTKVDGVMCVPGELSYGGLAG